MSRRLVAKVSAGAIFLSVIVAAEPGAPPVVSGAAAVRPAPKARSAPKAAVSFGTAASAAKSEPVSAPIAFSVPAQPPPIAATLRDSLTTDTNADGQPGPGDTLTYTATLTAGASAATGVTLSIPLDPNTTLVPGSLVATPAGVDDSYATNQNVALMVPAATGVLANDFAGLPAGAVTAFQTPTPNGGTVSVAADGGFTYTPATGFTGTDTFTYTVTNGSGASTATVTIDIRIPAGAVDDSFNATKDVPLVIAAPGVLANDAGFPAPTVTPATVGTSNGGSVTIAADGSFTYAPPPGFVSPPADVFAYTISNVAGTSSASAHITVDAAPAMIASVPAANAEHVATDTNISITFSEPVTVSPAAFTLACPPAGALRPITNLTGPGPATTFILDPVSLLPAGLPCQLTVAAGEVSDVDGNDPPDHLLADAEITFITDLAPSVLSTTPANGATGVALNGNVTIAFSEPVNVTGNWFQIVCSVSGTRNPGDTNVTGGPTAFTIDPTVDFLPGDSCTTTVFAAQVSDQDPGDPPDTPAADYVFAFAMDAAPSVVTTVPANGAANIATNTNLTMTFSENVDVSGAWFGISCTSSGSHAAAASGGPLAFTLDPAVDFTAGETCTVTVTAAQVTDQDTNDAPDNMLANFVFSFTLEQAPGVTATTPTNGAIAVATTANIDVTFSEPVTATAATLTIACATSGAHTVTASGGPTTWTFNPDVDFTQGESCTATVHAAQVADEDAVDPPDAMPADVVFSFTVDQAPSVTATTPTNAATDRTTNTDLTITFSEPVTLTGSWFTVACTVSGSHTAAVTGGPTTWTLNPDADFTQGETCTVTVLAAQVSDNDAGDPPDTLAADYVFSFTIDAAPAVTTTAPVNGASGVAVNGDITITFSEPVDVAADWFQVVCTVSGLHLQSGFVVTGGPSTFTLNPNSDFLAGETCTPQVFANRVTDQDGNDPPDQMLSNHIWTFSTDAAPGVVASTPANGAVSVLTNANIDVTFSEPVNAAGGSFGINCVVSGNHTFVLSGGPGTFTLNPDTDFTPGETCTVTTFAAGVTDQDANDPPDTMLANFVFSFTIEAAPFVASSVPADTGVQGTNQNITITFNEPVNVTGDWFAIACPSGTQNVADANVTTADNTTFTINPNTDFITGEGPCTLTVFAAQVTDQDGNDPPDGMVTNAVINFTIDVPPAVQATDPANGSSNAGPTQNVTITFSEPVNVSGTWFSIACTTSGSHTATVSGGPTTYTLDPNSDFVAPETCTVTVFAAQVTDQDTGDPPDTMAADFVFSFATDAAPSVTATTPTNGALDQAGNANVTITFSEAVNVTGTWFQIACPTSGTRTPANTVVTGGPTTFTLNPNVDFASAETCTTTVFAAQVTDVDANDPPDNMAADFVFSFAIDAAPQVATTVPANGATSLAANTTMTIDFSESVNVAAGGVTIGCPGAVTFTPALPQGPVTSLVLTPSSALPSAATCTVTVVAANVSDADANDPPNLLDGNGDGTTGDNYVFSFTVDAAPRVTLPTSPANGATNQATNTNITITFSEPVDLAAGAVTLACPAAVPFSSTPALPATGATSIVLDPTSDLPTNATCTVTVVAANVADTDTADPPDQLDGNGDGVAGDNHVFSFTTDAAPRVNLPTSPANGATNVPPASNITITFSELVNVAAGGITVACPVGTPIAFTPTLPQNGISSIVLDPTTSLPGNQTCTVTVVATNVTDADANDPPDQLDGNGDGVSGDDHVFSFTVAPEAVDDSYNVSPHLTLTVPAGTGVKANDNPNTATITGFGNSLATANGTVPNGTNTITTTLGTGGGVTLNADGSFTYIPPPDIVNATDHFFYTVTGGDTADVSLVIQNQTLIWFVDASYGGANGTSNGTQGRPFTLLTGAGSFDASTLPDNNTNDWVFIKQGSYTCGVSMVNTQKIVGDGSSSDLQTLASLTPVTGSSLPAFTGTDPVLSISSAASCVTTAANNTIRGVTIQPNNAGATGVSGSAVGTLTMSESTINGSGRALNLTTSGTLAVTLDRLVSTGSSTNGITLSGVGGTLTVNNAGGTSDIQGATAADVSVNGGSVSIAYDGNITQANNAPLLDVLGGHSGTITFQTGALSATNGTGLQFNNADGTYNFNTTSGSTTLNGGDAGIDITTGSGGGFTFGRSATPSSFVITKGNSGNAFTVDGSVTAVTSGVTYNGNITQSNAGAMVSVTGHSTGTITFQAGTLSAGAGTGLQFTNADGTYNFNGATTLNGGDAGIDILTGSAGTFAFGGTTITNPTGVALNVDGSTTAVTGGIAISGTISKTSSGRLIDFNNYDAGTATISGTLTCSTSCQGIEVTNDGTSSGTVNFSGGAKTLNTGATTAVNLDNNDGGTVNFTGGGLDIDTTSGTGFNAINGGTVTVQGSSNTIVSTTGTALNIANTTIGANDVTFLSISANGAANGIVLNNTGSTGGLTVTGDGNTTVGGNNSGGTIQNTTGVGISLTSTFDPSFTNVRVQTTTGHGVGGTDVTNFTFNHGKIDDSNTDALTTSEEANIGFYLNETNSTRNNLDGTVNIIGNQLTNAQFHGIDIFNFSGTIANITISNNTITSDTATANSQGSGIRLIAFGSASTIASVTMATIDNNVVTNFPSGSGIQVQGGNGNLGGPSTGFVGHVGSGTDVINLTNNNVSGASAVNRIGTFGLVANVNGLGQGNFNIDGNTISNTTGNGISVGSFGFANAFATITDNVLNTHNASAAAGIGAGTSATVTLGAETPTLTVRIERNDISNNDGNGILVTARDASGTVNARILDNTVDAPLSGNRPGIRVDAGNGISGDDVMNLEISGNTSAGSGLVPEGIGLRKQGTTATVNDFNIYDAVGGPSLATNPTNAQVVAFVGALNPGSAVNGATGDRVLIISGDAFQRTATQPLLAEGAGSTANPRALTQAELDRSVDAARTRFAGAGLSVERRLALERITFTMEPLAGDYLSSFALGQIAIDADAAGRGWFVDATPLDDLEFDRVDARQLTAAATSPAAGHYDLLTALLHEMEHASGQSDVETRRPSGDLMTATLPVGVRRGPLPLLASRSMGIIAAPMALVSGETVTVNVGTLPAGKSIVITYQATIAAAPITGPGFALSTQGTVTGTNFTAIVTDDPDTADVDDATRTAMACPTIAIAPADVPPAVFGAAMASITFTATGGIGTTTLALSGTLPAGVSFDAPSATLGGTPTEVGSFPFTITATDQNGCEGTKSYTLLVDSGRTVLTGADAGGGPHVRRFSAIDGTTPTSGALSSFFAFDASFAGGVRVAEGDVNGDGEPDYIAAAGPGADARINVFDGATGALVYSILAFEPEFRGGVFVAAGDVDGDGFADIIAGSGGGRSGQVRVFSGSDGHVLRDLFVFEPAFTGGVSVAAGDVNGDGRADLVVGSGIGRPSEVRVLNADDGSLLRAFTPYGAFPGGVFVAAGDVTGDGFADIVTGAGAGGGPHVVVVDGVTGASTLSFFAFEPGFAGGVRVAAGDVSGDGRADVIVGSGPGRTASVRVFNGATAALVSETEPYGPYLAGLFVATAVPLNRMAVNPPAPGSSIAGPFMVAGWGFVENPANAGIAAIHVWAVPVLGGAPTFLGLATLGDTRPDVAALFGAQYGQAGFHLDAAALPPGAYYIAVYAQSSVTGTFQIVRVVPVIVTP